jgi:hypothetical protein
LIKFFFLFFCHNLASCKPSTPDKQIRPPYRNRAVLYFFVACAEKKRGANILSAQTLQGKGSEGWGVREQSALDVQSTVVGKKMKW